MNRLKLSKIVDIPKSDPVILYKKLRQDMKSPFQLFKYMIRRIYFVKKFDEDIHKCCTKGRIYSVSERGLKFLPGDRYFKVHIWGKCILETINNIGSEYLKIVEELKPKKFAKYMSSVQAYFYCLQTKDIKEIRDRINDSHYAFHYCKNIKDRKNVRDKIFNSKNKNVNSGWAYLYCMNIRNRKEIRNRIIDLKLIQCLRNKERC